MAMRVLLHLGDATHKCIFTNLQFNRTGHQVTGLFKQIRHFKKQRNVDEISKSLFKSVKVENEPSIKKKFLKGLLFASTFSGASFLAATILEYERIRSRTYKGIQGLQRLPFSEQFGTTISGWRGDIRNWWTNLTEGERQFYFICYANALVFLAWRIPQFQPIMLKYFCTNPGSNIVCLPMLLSMFSHYNLWHLAANMYVLHSFSSSAVAYLGREHFLAVYLSSGLFANVLSNAYKMLLGRREYSLGASGAIMGILSFICMQFPDTKLSIIMLPQFTFSAETAIKSVIAFDLIGCVMRFKFLDHAAHLGGAFFGLFWQKWGIDNVWRQRSPVLSFWHELRSPKKPN